MTATNLLACRFCGQIHAPGPSGPGLVAACRRCGAALEARTSASLPLSAAFSAAALLLYVPANFFPILRIDMYGAVSENTVWQGCVKLYQGGDVVIALIVFLASVVIPCLKLLGLFFLTVSSWRRWPRLRRTRTLIFRAIDAAGRWAMLDVFALAVMVSLVRLRSLATVVPGSGALAFAAVVVLTILASQTFDPRLIWDDEDPP
ncbi:MAG TPA: paraquat-inducible protein A [Elusimicrobiota bacterium]|jgi:paraquat-inducible protein A|nr:paraquat-inducible protein A [Elusimicrobiota bacterium]